MIILKAVYLTFGTKFGYAANSLGVFNMKIGLPIWGQRLSPVLDFAHQLLVVEVRNGVVTQRRYHKMNPQLPAISQATVLSDLQISMLICGSISLDLANLIRPCGIRIIPFITGEVEEILQAYLNNSLSDPKFMLPGVHTRNETVQ
jgi:predicted Fe-Mo cluster-binding NifX family protein